MKKKEFLEKLEKRLSILNDEERKDIVNEYKDHLERKIESGMTEEEAVKDFGDFDILVKDILSAYKINENYDTKDTNKWENTFNVIVDEMVKFFKKLVDIISNKTGEDLLRIICKIILLLVLIWILRIPFWLIRAIGVSIFNVLPGFLDSALSTIWVILVETSYFILSILMLYNLVKKMIFEEESISSIPDAKVEPTKKVKTTKKKEPVKEEPKKETKNYANIFLNPVMAIIKAFVVLATLPLVFSLIGLTIAIGVMLALLFKGVYLISAFLIVIGCVLINYAILKLIYRIVFKEEKK